jgi:hypothetical protein
MPVETTAIEAVPFRRIATAPLVLLDDSAGAFGCGSTDHWAHGNQHVLFVSVHDLPPFPERDATFLRSLPLLATSVLMSAAHRFPDGAVDTAALTWYFLFPTSNPDVHQWQRVSFAKVYPERVTRLRSFPRANETPLFAKPEISAWTPPASASTPATDASGDVMTYRTATLQALEELGGLVDAAVCRPGATQTWQGDRYVLDHCISESIRRRTLLVRRSKDLLQEEVAAFLADHPEASQVFSAALPKTGFQGVAVDEVITHTHDDDWVKTHLAEKPQRVEHHLTPSWRGPWNTRVPARHDYID